MLTNFNIENEIYERNTNKGGVNRLDKFFTHRGTCVEIFDDPIFGHVCLMDGKVQSAKMDEEIYHSYLASLGTCVDTTTKKIQSYPRRVLIIGSGEGCLAREVLRWPETDEVVMVDWDADIIDAFRTRWNIWAGNSTWNNLRLKVEIADVWELLDRVDNKTMWKFDCILVDLFDPDKRGVDGLLHWEKLMGGLNKWLTPGGRFAAYCGMQGEDVAEETVAYFSGGGEWRSGIPIKNSGCGGILDDLVISKKYIPSFGGEAVFVSGRKAIQ